MSDLSLPPPGDGGLLILLLDPATGRPVRTWAFEPRPRITIGRAPDQDVEIADPYVSRCHAELVWRDGSWRLVSLGRNGVLVGSELLATEHPVARDLDFRLGRSGPALRLQFEAQQSEILATISCDTLSVPVFQLDEQKLRDEVGEIADGAYFQTLQQRARQLRGQRHPS